MECLAYKGLGMSQYSFIQTTGRYNVRKSTIYSMFSFRPLTFFCPRESWSPRNLITKKFSPHKFGPHLNTKDDFSKCYYCRFALGPLELRVIKTLDGSTSSAAAVTDTMLGLMDMQIDAKTSSAAITDVYFDEPGGVSVTGNLKRKRAHLKHNSNGYSPYRMELASRAKKSLEQVARLVVASDKK